MIVFAGVTAIHSTALMSQCACYGVKYCFPQSASCLGCQNVLHSGPHFIYAFCLAFNINHATSYSLFTSCTLHPRWGWLSRKASIFSALNLLNYAGLIDIHRHSERCRGFSESVKSNTQNTVAVNPWQTRVSGRGTQYNAVCSVDAETCHDATGGDRRRQKASSVDSDGAISPRLSRESRFSTCLTL